jgi:predicted kinase
MADYAVLVNGLPGAGKSTLAARLAPVLGIPLIAKDAIKEALAAAAPGVPSWAFGPLAAQSMWDLASAVPGGVLLDSWWFRPRDHGYAEAGLLRSGAKVAVEIWCDLPTEVAFARFTRRRRTELYEDDRHAQESWPTWAAEAAPLAIADVLTVRTDQDVDLATLAHQVDTALGRQPGTASLTIETRHTGAAARPPAPLPNAATGGGHSSNASGGGQAQTRFRSP